MTREVLRRVVLKVSIVCDDPFPFAYSSLSVYYTVGRGSLFVVVVPVKNQFDLRRLPFCFPCKIRKSRRLFPVKISERVSFEISDGYTTNMIHVLPCSRFASMAHEGERGSFVNGRLHSCAFYIPRAVRNAWYLFLSVYYYCLVLPPQN